MHDLAPLIKDLAIILGVAGIVVLLFQKLRQPIVLGYLIAGVIVGPYTPPYVLIRDIPNIRILSELGVVFLMFSLGLEFSIHKLKRVGFSASITGFIEVIFMLLLGFLTGKLMDWPAYDSLFLGAALSISSTTIIIKALEGNHLKHKRFAEIVFGILIIEDLLAILLMVGLTTVVETHNIFSSAMAWAAAKLVLVIGGWFLIGYFLVPPLFRKIMAYSNKETLTIVSIALCLFLVCVAHYFHYSSALGAFIMGSVLAETSFVHQIEELIKPVRNVFAAVFFVSVGMLLDPSVIWHHLPLVLLICVITIGGKIITAGFGAFLTGQSVNNSLRIGFSMAQIGEFSFIIAGLGLALNATSSLVYPIIVAVSAITTFTTPYLIKLSGHLSNKVDQNLSDRGRYLIESYTNWVYRLLSSSKKNPLAHIAILRFVINGVIVAILFTLSETLLLPRLLNFIESPWLSTMLAWFITVVLSSPFIWGMLNAARLNPSEEDGAANNYFVLYGSRLIVIIEISILSITYFYTWLITLLLCMIALVFFIILYKHLDKSYRWFENRLITNLKATTRQKKHYTELEPWDIHFVEVEVNRYSPLAGKPLSEYQLRQQLGVHVAAIYRDAHVILNPRGHELIQAFDKLVLLGNDEQIEKFSHQFIKNIPETEEVDLLEKFTVTTLLIDEEHPLVGKAIKQTAILEKFQGIIIGIERQGKRLLYPNSETVLESGDVLFIAGNEKLIEKYLD